MRVVAFLTGYPSISYTQHKTGGDSTVCRCLLSPTHLLYIILIYILLRVLG